MLMFGSLSAQTADSIITSLGNSLESFPPVQHLILFLRMCTDFLLDRTVLIIVSFLMGMIVLLAAEVFLFWRYVSRAPVLPPPKFEDTEPHLPEVLSARLDHSSLKQKEDCIWLNFLMQFLFSELRDSLQLRRFLTKKIQLEFEEVLRSRSGVLVDELFLRDFHLGNSFPVITGMSVEKSDVSNGVIQTLNLKTHVAYDGGFQIAIDAALPFHRMAFVSVTVLKLRGLVRLQFTQLPFSHWNLAFYEEPELDVDVVAQLDGRPMPKLKNIIANQIRKIIRRKHTLPMYKMRYKPFFQPVLDPGLARDARIHIDGAELGYGNLEVTVIEANRLPFVVKGSSVYCTVSVDELPWKEQMIKVRSNRKVITVELVKNSSDQSLGMTVKDELLPDRLHPVVVIGEVNVGSPAHMANVLEGDILVGVGGGKVTSAKQATKNLKWAKDRIQVQIERAGSETTSSASTKDDTLLPRKVSSWHDGQISEKIADTEALVDPAHNLTTPSNTDSPKTRIKSHIYQLYPEGKRTTLTEASVNPQWNHKFAFSVDSTTNYLNVCLWSKGGDRTGKPYMISSTKQDVLLGYVSLNLDEIYLHCLMTLNGTMKDKVKLKHGHYKTEDELIKTWSVHKGWDMNQMYGNISLSYHYVPTNLSEDQRNILSGSKGSSDKVQKELFDRYKAHDEDGQIKASPTKIAEDLKSRDLHEGHHQFGSTTFMTAIFCDYCGKKIWMKEAFKCQTCSMVCHKKCLVKCLVNTVCTDAGVMKRTAITEAWQPLASTGKLKQPVVSDEVVRNYGFQDEEASVDGLTTNDASMNTSESMQSLTTFFDVVYIDSEKGLANLQKQENLQEANPLTRFRGLKEQTDRMKDSVLKHLRRNKIPAAFNDKAIMSAKELGARLFLDMDPSLRKDKLEELVKKLDMELKAEMENKESLEQELALLEAAEQKTPSSKRKSEIKSLSNKVFRSVEKQDAMRLLMLQYCSGLQNCINSLEAEVSVIGSRPEIIDGHQTLQPDFEPPKMSRSAAVGGFVRRASSSVKEKMSLIKKDFGKKGTKTGEDDRMSLKSVEDDSLSLKSVDDDSVSLKSVDDDKLLTSKSVDNKLLTFKSAEDDHLPPSISGEDDTLSTSKSGDADRPSSSKNNNGMNTTDVKEGMSSQGLTHQVNPQRRSQTRSIRFVEDHPDNSEVGWIEEASGVTEMSVQMSEAALVVSHPAIEIYIDEVDKPESNGREPDDGVDPNEPRVFSQEDAGIPRSSSDSRLEISKMLGLRPEDILRYRGTSLPRLPGIDDSDSDSDYLIIESSDEHVVTDSSDSENERDVDFKGGKKKPNDDDSDDGRDEHRGTVQQLQTFQV